MRILTAIGTRPEIIKLGPVVGALRARDGVEVRAVATGQHYDPALAGDFHDRFGWWPDATWTLAGSESERVGGMLQLAMEEVAATRPDVVLVLGDTYTVPMFCLAARRHGVPVAHLEAGLRSFNPRSMEEVNRRTAAALASLHFAPTALAARFLAEEGIPQERVHVVGNPVIDVLRGMGARRRPPEERLGAVVTAHRPTNVDDPDRLAALVELLRRLAAGLAPVTFPVHPRTRARLDAAGVLAELAELDGLTLTDPLPYDEMLTLLAGSKVAVTDSGGLQEEASWLGVPVVVLRTSTPRWEGVTAGTSVLAGLDVDRALRAALALAADDEQARVREAECPYGDGRTAERVAGVLTDPDVAPLLRLDEPDLRDVPAPA